jgi:hypothetical protein
MDMKQSQTDAPDRVHWLINNAIIFRRRGGPSLAIADNLEACAKEMEEMRSALRAMAALKLTTEMPEANRIHFDHGYRFNMLVEKAREIVGEPPRGFGNG